MMTLETPAVSLLDVLLSVSTEMEAPDFTLDSAFQGQTCLVAVNETDLTATLFGLLDSTKRNARKHQHYSAYVNATGETVTLTLSEATAGVQWSLQFPELHP